MKVLDKDTSGAMVSASEFEVEDTDCDALGGIESNTEQANIMIHSKRNSRRKNPTPPFVVESLKIQPIPAKSTKTELRLAKRDQNLNPMLCFRFEMGLISKAYDIGVLNHNL